MPLPHLMSIYQAPSKIYAKFWALPQHKYNTQICTTHKIQNAHSKHNTHVTYTLTHNTHQHTQHTKNRHMTQPYNIHTTHKNTHPYNTHTQKHTTIITHTHITPTSKSLC